MNRKNRKQRKLKFKILSLIVILILIAIIVFVYKLFTVQKIETEGFISCMVDSKPKQLEKLIGQNIFLININKIEEELKKQFLCLNQLTLTKNYPSKVKIGFVERQPKVILVSVEAEATDSASDATPSANIAPKQKASFLADDTGLLFAKSNNENLPKVFFPSDLNMGQKIEEIKNIIKIIDQLNSINLRTTQSYLNSDNTYLMYSNPPVYFNLNDKIDFQIASLQLILKTDKINHRTISSNDERNKDVRLIDLRFDKPIIR